MAEVSLNLMPLPTITDTPPQFVSERVYEMRAQINAGRLGESEKVPMLQRLLQYRYASSNELMPDHDIISESMGHMYVTRFYVFP
jgi:hypothetical protein